MPSPLTLLAEATQIAGLSDDRRQEPPSADRFDNVKVPTLADLENHLNTCTSWEDTVDASLSFIESVVDQCSAKHQVRDVVGYAVAYLRLYHNQATKERVKDAHVTDPTPPSSPGKAPAYKELTSIQDTLTAIQLHIATVHGCVREISRQQQQQQQQPITDSLNPPTTYAEAAARPPNARPVTQPKHSNPKPTTRNDITDIIIDISQVDTKDPIRSMPPHALKSHIDQALQTVAALSKLSSHGVSSTAKGSIVLRAHSPKEAAQIRQHSDSWLPLVAADARLHRKLYRVEVRSVPVTFNVKGQQAKDAIFHENPGTFGSPARIIEVKWKNPQRNVSLKKAQSSLILTTDDINIADTLISQSLTISGALKPTTKYIPPPVQCYHCQALDSHIKAACPHKDDDTKLVCPRCGQHHSLKDCKCPAKTPCTNVRRCTHLPLKCANCQGAHKTFSMECPAKRAAVARIRERYDADCLFFDPTFEKRLRTRADNSSL